MGDVYSLEVLGVVAGQPCASVMHFESAEETTPDPVTGSRKLILAWIGAGAPGSYQAAYLDMTPENYFMKGIRARRISAGGGPNVAVSVDNLAGERPGNADVSGVGPVVLWHAQQAENKWVTGKLFVPGVSVDDVAENVFSDALLAKLQAFGEIVFTPIGVAPEGPFTQRVWSPTATLPLEILSNSNSLKVGTQRRRYVPL